MNQKSSKHSREHGNLHSGKTKHFADSPPGRKTGKWAPHRDWRVWVAVGLMLLAMVAYVMSFDESLRPGERNEQPPVAVENL